ncbi:MAG: hypothetical protein ACSLFP_16960, partial [Acidimicrobiales bacterium]
SDEEPSSPAAVPASAESQGSRGFGGLAMQPTGASMHTLAAQGARAANGNGEVTGSGLVRRVPGAQRPDATFSASRGSEPATAEPEAEPARSTPEDVYSFLSSFQSGVARGRADAAGDAGTESEESGR